MDGLDLNVSRETSDKLRAFADLVEKWTAKINLVSKQSVGDIWNRHIVDSCQVFTLAPSSGKWVDLGSGGGFPGIVAAILSQGSGAFHQFNLVESDNRKTVFLRTAVRELGLEARVISQRIEVIDPLEADILTARALTDLNGLLGFSARHLKQDGTAIFPKGAQWEKEVALANQQWSYTYEAVKSRTHPEAALLKIKDILRV